MSKATTDPAVIKAVIDWWLEQFSGFPGRSTGIPDGTVVAMGVLTAALARPLTPEQANSFRAAASEWLTAQLEQRRSAMLTTDHGPEADLRVLMKHAGISPGRAPHKVVMWIERHSVTVRPGYGHEVLTLFPTTVP